MKHIKIVFCLFTALSIASCQKSMTSEEINEKMSSGVVMIWNYFYYSIDFPNGDTFYFTGVDDEGHVEGFTFDEEEAWDMCGGINGTGFFISEDGQIMTNRHVAHPEVSSEVVTAIKKSYRSLLKSYYKKEMEKLEQAYPNYAGNETVQKNMVAKYRKYNDALSNLEDMDASEADFNIHPHVSVSYNGSHIIKEKDFNSCSVVAVSNEENVDLAILQLDDSQTPEDAFIFHLTDNDKPLAIGQQLYMIAFNKGASISKTAQGIRSQMYPGNVTQKDDGEKILYSIPSQPGSSGSPVIDEYGNWVAVHFAGWSGTQGFNYGIPSKRIRQFLEEN